MKIKSYYDYDLIIEPNADGGTAFIIEKGGRPLYTGHVSSDLDNPEIIRCIRDNFDLGSVDEQWREGVRMLIVKGC